MLKSKVKNIWIRSIIVAIICSCCLFFIYKAGGFNLFENKAYDKAMILTSKYHKPSEDISIIVVDQFSIDWVKENKGWSWPWPREAYGQIIDFLYASGAKSVMFDVFYTEPSIYGEDDDKAFAESIAKSGFVTLPIFKQDDGNILYPVEPINSATVKLADVRSVMDEDGIIRRYRPATSINGKEYYSLGMVPLDLENEKLDFPTMAEDGTVRLRYLKSINEYYPDCASDLISSYDSWKNGEEGYYSTEDFKDKYVFFALYAPGLFDICATPVSKDYPGVGVHITALDNYLNKNYIKEVPDYLVFFWFLFIALMSCLLVVSAEKLKSQWKSILFRIISFVLSGVIILGIHLVLFRYNYYLPLIGPVFDYIISFAVMFGLIYIREGKRTRFIKAAFCQCLSKDVVNEIVNNPDSFTLGGKKVEMSAIFTDIEKFSSFSELLTANQLGTLLNYYLTKMSDIIINERGTVDKYEGDAIVAMMGAPVVMEDHAVRACRAALKMKKEEEKMNKEIVEAVKNAEAGNSIKRATISEELLEAFKIMVKNHKVIFTRIGINSGEMIAGYFGSSLKKNYTMMGNNVNLAARLEGVNKQYSTFGILISEFTKNLIGDRFVVRRLDQVQVVNVNTPIRLYELLGEVGHCSEGVISYAALWEKAMDYFESCDYGEALNQFKNLKAKKGDDKVADYYIDLIERFFIKGTFPTEADSVGVSFNKQLGVFKLLQK